PNEQVEWTFPTDYKNAYFDEVMPETLALMRLLDATRPALYVALHNGEMGGVYYYLNRDEPGLADALRALPGAFGLPLDEGEPESPYLRSYAPAVYDMGTIADAYDWLETLGVDPTGQIGGSSSGEYTSKHGTLSLVAELPYWVHPAAADTGRSDESYRDVVLRMSTQLGETAQSLGELLNRAEPLLRLDTSFVRATRAFVPALQSIADSERIRAGAAESARPATVAEVFSCADLITCFRYRYGGMLVRALSAEVGAGTAGPALRAVHADAVALYEAWLAEPGVADDATPAPLMALVGVQYGSILAAANAVAPSAVAPAAVPPAAGLAHGGHGGRGQA
ncbi:MAG: Peptidase, partial [Frondihabitans sp.]|nr:Peptidase [Frondihabitans sp.]